MFRVLKWFEGERSFNILVRKIELLALIDTVKYNVQKNASSGGKKIITFILKYSNKNNNYYLFIHVYKNEYLTSCKSISQRPRE